MAVVGNILIGMMVDTTRLSSGIRKASEDVRSFTGVIGSAKTALLGFAGSFAAISLSDFLVDGIRQASDFEETISKVDVIFGESSDLILTRAKQMSSAYGVVEREFADAAASFGAMFKGSGVAADEAARLGVQLTELGMDLASFGNASNEEVFTAISAALRGEMDPIERFNVFLSAAKVEAEALALGLASSKSEIDDYAKKMATLSLIMKQTTDAQGDLERTAGGAANQFRKFSGQLDQLQTTIGSALLPVANELVTGLNDLLSGLVGTTDAALSGAAGMHALEAGTSRVAEITKKASEYAEMFGLAWKFAQVVVTGVVSASVSLLLGLAETIETVINLIPGVEVSFTETLRAIESDMDHLLSEHIDNFKEAWSGAVPEIQTVAEEVQEVSEAVQEVSQAAAESAGPEITDEMRRQAEAIIKATRTPLEEFQAEMEQIQRLADAGLLDQDTVQRAVEKAKEDLAKATEDVTEDKKSTDVGPTDVAAAALEQGSVEARRAILAFRQGGKDGQQETAANTAKLVAQGDRQLGVLAQIAGALVNSIPVTVGI